MEVQFREKRKRFAVYYLGANIIKETEDHYFHNRFFSQ